MDETSEYTPQPDDDEPMLWAYESSRNVTFKGENEESGYTKGEWRQMSMEGQNAAAAEYLASLVDVYTNAD